MRDIIELVPRVRLAINILLLFLGTSFFSQTKDIPVEYRVINDFFSQRKNIKLYKTTFDKGWADYFEPGNFDEIKNKASFPIRIEHSELEQMLTEPLLKEIRNSIQNSLPTTWESKYLNNKINLEKQFDTPEALNNNVIRLSMPIVVGNIAILKKTDTYECPIYILKNNGKNWEVIYTFYDWLILH